MATNVGNPRQAFGRPLAISVYGIVLAEVALFFGAYFEVIGKTHGLPVAIVSFYG